MGYREILKKSTGAYGILHALGCPMHGALGLALKLGIIGLPGPIISTLQAPHDFVSHKLFEPAYRFVLNESEEHDHSHEVADSLLESIGHDSHFYHHDCDNESRAEHYAHVTTDLLGWGAFAGFLGLQGASLYKRRKLKN